MTPAPRPWKTLGAAFALFALSSPAAEPPSARPFGCMDTIRDVQVSPDGRSVAFLLSDGEASSLAVYHLDTGKTEILFQVAPLQFSYAWKGDNRLLVFQNRGTRRVMMSVVPGAKALTSFPNYGPERLTGGVVDWLPGDPNHVLVAGRGWGVMDATSGDIAPTSISEDEIGAIGYVADQTGAVRLRFHLNRDGVDLESKQDIKALFAPVYHWTWDDPQPDDLGFARDPNVAYFLTNTEGDWGEIRPFDLTARKFGPALVKGNGAAIEGAIFAPDPSRIIGVGIAIATGRAETWLDPTARLMQATLDASLPKRRNRIVSFSTDLQVAAVNSIKDSEPGEYLVLDHRKGTLQRLGLRRAQLAYTTFVPAQVIDITARDRFVIHAILLQPHGAAGPRALVVIPRPNPFAYRDGTYYDGAAQYLVSLGYAVLEVDYRGAEGYGLAFRDAGRHQFARKIPDDIEDATRWSLENHVTAPGRIGILGVDDGATQALIAATHTPDLYGCVVNWNGEADLAKIEYTDGAPWTYRRLVEYFYSDQPAAFEAKSALRAMGRLIGPVLNIYPSGWEYPDRLNFGPGGLTYNDSEVNERRSRVEHGLSSAHRPYETAPAPKPDEVKTGLDTDLHYYTVIGAFLLTHLPPNPPGS